MEQTINIKWFSLGEALPTENKVLIVNYHDDFIFAKSEEDGAIFNNDEDAPYFLDPKELLKSGATHHFITRGKLLRKPKAWESKMAV